MHETQERNTWHWEGNPTAMSHPNLGWIWNRESWNQVYHARRPSMLGPPILKQHCRRADFFVSCIHGQIFVSFLLTS